MLNTGNILLEDLRKIIIHLNVINFTNKISLKDLKQNFN